MNKNILVKALTVPLAIVLILYLYLDRKDQKPYLPKTNPIARGEYEFMRTKSPISGEIPEDIRRKELKFARTLPTRKEINEKILYRGQPIASLNWKNRGPYNVGGRTRALAFDLDDETIMFAGGASGGMWRSTDAGNTWSLTTNLQDLQSVTTVAQDPRSGERSTWYYGTGEYNGASAGQFWGNKPFKGDGIFKSTDGGQNWTLLASTSTNSPQVWANEFNYVHRIKVSKKNGYVFAATARQGKLKLSKDGGSTWSDVLKATDADPTTYTDDPSFVDVDITSDGTIYSAVGGGIWDGAKTDKSGVFRSADDGTSFTDITPANFPANFQRIVLDISASNEKVVYFFINKAYFGTAEWYLWKYTYVSGDGSGSGGTWVDLSSNIPPQDAKTSSQRGYNMVLAIKPDNENHVVLGGTNLFFSSDGFTTSSSKHIGGYVSLTTWGSYVNHHPDNHSAVFLPSDPKVMISGHDGGLSRTEDVTASQVNWMNKDLGYVTGQFYHVSIDPSGTEKDLIVGGLQDNSTWKVNSGNSNANWDDIGSGDGSYSTIGNNGKAVIMSAQTGWTFFHDYENNSLWNRLQIGGASGNNGEAFINPLAMDPSNYKILYVLGGNFIWRNNDITVGESQYEKLTNTDTGSQITNFGVSTTNPSSLLYYATSSGNVYKLADANTTTNAPADISPGTLPSGGWVSSVGVNPEDGNEVIMTLSNYEVISVWYTADGGTSWQNISGNLEENADGTGNGPSVRWGIILPYNLQKNYLLGTSVGVYSTSVLNGMSTVWGLEGQNSIGNLVVDALAGRASDGMVVAATHGRGVYSASFANPGADVTAPVVQALSPADDATGVGANDNLVVTMDEKLSKGTGNITIYNSDESVFEQIDITGSKVTVAEKVVTIDPDGTFLSPGSYYVKIASSTIQDEGGNAYAGIQDKTSWNFATVDAEAPTVATLIPADDATSVAVGVSLVMTMDENISSGSGDIVIYKPDDTVFETIPITDTKVTVANDKVTVDPSSDLAENTAYYVQVAATALKDASANAYAGIQDKTTWNFTTVDPAPTPNTAPVLTAVKDTTIAEDKTVEVTLSATDAENDPLTYSGTSTKTEVAISISVDKLTLTPKSGWNGETYITASASDGNLQDSKSFKLTVTGVNDAPVIVNPIDITINEDDSTTIKLFATDPEGDPVTFTSSADTSSIQLFLTNDILDITPVANWNGTSKISVNATDGNLSDFESFTLTVTSVNDLPTEFNLNAPSNESMIIINDYTYSDSLIFSWSESFDADGDTLIYSWVGTGGLEQLDIPDTTTHEMTIAYSDIYNMIDQSHLAHWSEASEISGTWAIVVKDKEANTQSVNGPFSLTIRENVLALDGRDMLPEIFALHENYPNPFNPVTNITYDLPERIMVRLTIFDITGRRIRQIVNGYQEAGFQSVLWEGTNDRGQPVSGGLYFYQLKAGEFIKTRKMLLIK